MMWVHFGDVVIVTDAVTAATTAGGGNSICTFGTRCTSDGMVVTVERERVVIDRNMVIRIVSLSF